MGGYTRPKEKMSLTALYAPAVITTGTLRLQDQERPSGSGPSQVTGTGTAADILVFEGDHLYASSRVKLACTELFCVCVAAALGCPR